MRAPSLSVRAASRALLVVTLVTIGALTLLPGSPEERTAPVTCVIACGDRGLADVILNLALFVPLGAALRGLGWRARAAFAAALAVTLAVESAQYFLPGREAGLSDVIANALGGVLGYELARRARPRLAPSRRRSLSFLGVALGCWLATGRLLEPALPAGAYYGQWTPELERTEPYLGLVLRADVGPLEIPDGRLSAGDDFRVLWRARRALHVAAVAGPETESYSPILRIVTERGDEAIAVGAEREDLVLRHWTKGRGWRLDNPDARLRGALRDVDAGDTVRVSVRPAGERVCLSLSARESCSLGGRVGSGWSLLLYPNGWPGWRYAALDVIWLLGLVLPVAFWAPSARFCAAQGALLLSAAFLLPAVTPLLATGPVEVAAIVIGLALGYAARSWTAGRRLAGSGSAWP